MRGQVVTINMLYWVLGNSLDVLTRVNQDILVFIDNCCIGINQFGHVTKAAQACRRVKDEDIARQAMGKTGSSAWFNGGKRNVSAVHCRHLGKVISPLELHKVLRASACIEKKMKVLGDR